MRILGLNAAKEKLEIVRRRNAFGLIQEYYIKTEIAFLVFLSYNVPMSIQDLQDKLSPIFRQHGIKQASVFGSVSRGDDHPESDVDLLVKLGRPMGLVGLVGLVTEMEEMLGRKVDLLTDGGINKFLEPHILPDLKTIYEE